MKIFVVFFALFYLNVEPISSLSGHNEACTITNGTDSCDSSKFLKCISEKCQCEDPENQIFTFKTVLIEDNSNNNTGILRSRRSPKGGSGSKSSSKSSVTKAVTKAFTKSSGSKSKSSHAKSGSKSQSSTATEASSSAEQQQQQPLFTKVWSCYRKVSSPCYIENENANKNSSISTTTSAPISLNSTSVPESANISTVSSVENPVISNITLPQVDNSSQTAPIVDSSTPPTGVVGNLTDNSAPSIGGVGNLTDNSTPSTVAVASLTENSTPSTAAGASSTENSTPSIAGVADSSDNSTPSTPIASNTPATEMSTPSTSTVDNSSLSTPTSISSPQSNSSQDAPTKDNSLPNSTISFNTTQANSTIGSTPVDFKRLSSQECVQNAFCKAKPTSNENNNDEFSLGTCECKEGFAQIKLNSNFNPLIPTFLASTYEAVKDKLTYKFSCTPN